MPGQDSPISSQLDELPVYFARHLRQVGSSGLFAALPETPDPGPAPTSPQPLAPNISQYTVTEYYTMAAYPIVVCYPPDFANGVFATFEASNPGNDETRQPKVTTLRAERPPVVQDYKLTNDSEGRPFYNPLWCRVYAHYSLVPVTRTTSCIDGVPPRWELEVTGIPSGPSILSWYGDWTDMPVVTNLDVITTHLILHKEESFCCPGFRRCGDGCLDVRIDCKDDVILT